MSKKKIRYFCNECGYESLKWMGKCPSCNAWNSFTEEKVVVDKQERNKVSFDSKPLKITNIENESLPRFTVSDEEFNRVLGGGIVPGSLILIGGDPGIGKSTLLLQTSYTLAKENNTVLYVSGEESQHQIKLRAQRLNAMSDNLYVFSENNIDKIKNIIESLTPNIIIIDSIQTLLSPNTSSAAGSVSQIRECTSDLLYIAKTTNIPIFIVGHVTKDGSIAGPRVMEHMVDTVLYFEGNKSNSLRILRAVKNRFGSTNEIGVFAMVSSGLEPIANPSAIFLEDRSIGYSGCCVSSALEGTRPILCEVQSLLTKTNFGNPKRTTSGIDTNKLSLLLAVIEKNLSIPLRDYDTYIKITGGLKINQPSVDLAICASVLSSFTNKEVNISDAFIGEVGLTGEINRVSSINELVNEAVKLGFKRIFIPFKNKKDCKLTNVEIIGIKDINDFNSKYFR